jgi:transposase
MPSRSHGGNIKKFILATTVIGSILAVPNIASADVGDGQLACNAGEICFARDLDNTTYQKHFWYAGSHDGYTFTNVTTGATNQGNLKDGADQLRNRDSVCDVKVIDVITFLPDDSHTVANNGSWTALETDVRNQNDKHERVNC